MKVAVAITGASGGIYARRLMEVIAADEVLLTMTPDGLDVLKFEEKVPGSLEKFDPAVFSPKSRIRYFHYKDYYAPIASGSNAYEGLVIVPCSMNTLGKIAAGISDNLVVRAADTMLKERKKLILVTRETPYSLIHIENMSLVTRAGGIILPASPAFYHHPKNLTDAVDFVVNKILRALGLPSILPEWGK
ncbi:UbiX family flavin prenyltransferase [bacterium]|nr:UbiX family flavin prenyltransferase [bacterium]